MLLYGKHEAYPFVCLQSGLLTVLCMLKSCASILIGQNELDILRLTNFTFFDGKTQLWNQSKACLFISSSDTVSKYNVWSNYVKPYLHVAPFCPQLENHLTCFFIKFYVDPVIVTKNIAKITV